MRPISWLTSWIARLPLRWRVSLVSFGLLATTMLLVGIGVSTLEESVLLSNQADGLYTQANLLTNNVGGIDDKGQPTELLTSTQAQQFLSDTQTKVKKETLITILSSNGEVLAQSQGANETDTFSNAQIQGMLKGWQRDQNSYSLATTTNGQRQLVIFYPYIQIIDKQAMLYSSGILQLHTSTASIDATTTSTRLLLTGGILCGLLIAAALTLPLIRHALRPLSEIEQTSLRIAKGDLSLRLTEPETQDELGQLTRSFNVMVSRLETMFTRQKQFVSDVSHELRTPLTGLGGSLEMLLLEANNGNAEAARRLMVGMYSEVERMQRLVADLLVLSRLDEGQITLRTTTIDLNALLSDLTEQVRQLTQGQHIICHLPDTPLFIEGDSDQIRRVLLNILENAIKFTPLNGSITLSIATRSSEDSTFVAIKVRDTGIGIPAPDLAHIFDRFYRVDQSRVRTSAQSGSGLGLSIAQALIKAHGGSIELTSTPMQGTTVTILLPQGQDLPSHS